MQTIYEIVQQNPKFYAWAFGIINVAWGLFIYFNKQRHDQDLKRLEQELRFSSDRRLKIFDLKASQYSQYVTDLDSFGKKNQIEIPARMQPIFDKYLQDYLAATNAGDKNREREVIGWFSSQISALIQEGLQDVLKIKTESNRLKLIATDEMLETFEKIETLTQESMDSTNEFMKNFTEIVINQQNERSEAFQAKAAELSAEIQKYSKTLLNQMRHELSDI